MTGSSIQEIERSSPFPLTDTDRNILSLTDAQFKPQTWEELKLIIAQNDLSVLRRRPSDLKRYIRWSNEVKVSYGTVPNYIMAERLKWTPSEVSASKGAVFQCQSNTPFENDQDYKILRNDWPYGLAEGITHLIVWLKTRLVAEPTRGDLTDVAGQQVSSFVNKTFVDRLKSLPGVAEDKVIWFRNWTALQSVPGIEHVHVLLRNVPPEIVLEWTKGDTMRQGEPTSTQYC